MSASRFVKCVNVGDGIPLIAEKISTILKDADVTVESYWPSLFAKLTQRKNVDNLVLNVGAAGGAVVSVGGTALAAGGAAAVEAPVDAKKKRANPGNIVDLLSAKSSTSFTLTAINFHAARIEDTDNTRGMDLCKDSLD